MRRIGPTGILVATIVAYSAFLVAYVAIGSAPSQGAQQLTSVGLSLAMVLWVMADARLGRRTPCYDFGFLVAAFFPASLVWYVVWSRGRRGLLTLGFLSGLMLLPWASALAAWALRHGLP
jgi:hypothetical protein